MFRAAFVLLLLLTVGCTGPASYSLFVVHDSDLKQLSADGTLSDPILSGNGMALIHRFDAQTAAGWLVAEDGVTLDTFVLNADGTTSAGPNIPWVSSTMIWAEDARRVLYFDGPTLVDVDFDAGTVENPAPLDPSATPLALNRDATRSLWNIRIGSLNQLHVIDGALSTDPILQSLPENHMTQSPNTLGFNADSTRLWHIGLNAVGQRVFGYTELATEEFTEIEGWGNVQLVERQGEQMLVVPEANLSFHLADPDPPAEEAIFSGSWPLGGTTMGFSPDLQWVLWGTEMFDSAPGTFRYEMRPLPDNSGGTDSANYVDIIRDVDWNLSAAVVLN